MARGMPCLPCRKTCAASWPWGSKDKNEIICQLESEDILATKRVLQKLLPNNDVTGLNCSESGSALDCGESGSTLRFILPIAGVLGKTCLFTGKGRLPERPSTPLCEEMMRHGCNISNNGRVPFRLSGKLTGGVFRLPGNVSSQFFTGLLMALPLAEEDSFIEVEGKIESYPYVEMTLEVLKMSGITVNRNTSGFQIPGKQCYNLSGTVKVEGDWSTAAFWLSMGVIGCAETGEKVKNASEGISVRGLNTVSRQGDRKIIEILQRMGAHVEIKGDGQYSTVKVFPSALNSTEIDGQDIPDLVPILSVVAAAATGHTRIYNCRRLRLKESDRLKAIETVLQALGADVTATDDCLDIWGGKKLKGGTIDSFADHRIAMMAASAAGICQNPVIIERAQAVNKSYPMFFEDFLSLGGKVENAGDL